MDHAQDGEQLLVVPKEFSDDDESDDNDFVPKKKKRGPPRARTIAGMAFVGGEAEDPSTRARTRSKSLVSLAAWCSRGSVASRSRGLGLPPQCVAPKKTGRYKGGFTIKLPSARADFWGRITLPNPYGSCLKRWKGSGRGPCSKNGCD